MPSKNFRISLFRTGQAPWIEAAIALSVYEAKVVELRTGLRDVADVVALEDQLVLLVLRLVDGHTFQHWDVSNGLCRCQPKDCALIARANLFSQKVSNLNSFSTVLDDAVDREMGIYETHFVLEALTNERRVSERLLDTICSSPL